MIIVDNLPPLPDAMSNSLVSLHPGGLTSIVKTETFVARICLVTGNVLWARDRQAGQPPAALRKLPRRVLVSDYSSNTVWWDESANVFAEMTQSEDGGWTISGRCYASGDQLWERHFAVPAATVWENQLPSAELPRGELSAFLGASPNNLVICLARSDRHRRTTECQLDMTRIDPLTGDSVYHREFPDAYVGLVERRNFTGTWSQGCRLGHIDFESGVNSILHERDEPLSWPVHVDSSVAVAWFSKSEVGVDWVDLNGTVVRQTSFRQAKVDQTWLRPTDAGLAIQISDQKLMWLGTGDRPEWEARCKPYIYNVHCFAGTDVFVGTDGRGGRLFAFDRNTGKETLNLKPPGGGGMADLARIAMHGVLAVPFRITKRECALMLVDLHDHSRNLISIGKSDPGAANPYLGTWDHGALFRVGNTLDRVGIVDLRT